MKLLCFPVSQLVKNPPAVQETWVQSLGWEDPLEEGKGYLTPVFWPREFHELYSLWGHKESGVTEQLSLHFKEWNISLLDTCCTRNGSVSSQKACMCFKPFGIIYKYISGFPDGAGDKEPTCHWRRCKRHGFDPRVRKIPWKRAWQPSPVFLPGESHGQRSLEGYSP